ncbi:MAG: UDP-N-acetylmuramoyl-tripeptide--D-alanyl-D-alanine ligase [Pseudomonadota bacterium]
MTPPTSIPPLWTSADLALATGGTATAPFTATSLSIDTRSLEPGALFIALTDQRDGHDFASAADAAGASAALVSRPVTGDGPRLQVPDVLSALEAMAVAARARSGAVRCAVTGSVGKTSVKEMLAQIFRATGAAHWPEKSFNNHWGVPLTLARMPVETERAVFEIGMSTPGEIAPRSKLVRPLHALITKIAPAHLEGVGSIEGVADEKADIYAGVEAHGSILVPADDQFCDRLTAHGQRLAPMAEVFSFGESEAATSRVTGYDSDGLGARITITLSGTRATVPIRAVGEHWASNVAAALLVAWRTGISVTDAADALAGYNPPPGRGTAETLTLPGGGEALLVDDAYNANPESMRAALDALKARPGTRKLAALGEMLEIGPGSDKAHAGLAASIEGADIASVFLAGAAMGALDAALPAAVDRQYTDNVSALHDVVKNALKPGDTLLIKGSNASGMGALVKELRNWSQYNKAAVMEAGQNAPRGV